MTNNIITVNGKEFYTADTFASKYHYINDSIVSDADAGNMRYEAMRLCSDMFGTGYEDTNKRASFAGFALYLNDFEGYQVEDSEGNSYIMREIEVDLYGRLCVTFWDVDGEVGTRYWIN